MCHITSHLTSLYLLLSILLISSHLFSSHLISHLNSAHLITLHLISSYLISYLTSSHNISFHHIASHLISSYHISSPLITSISSHHIATHITSPHYIASHLITSFFFFFLNIIGLVALRMYVSHHILSNLFYFLSLIYLFVNFFILVSNSLNLRIIFIVYLAGEMSTIPPPCKCDESNIWLHSGKCSEEEKKVFQAFGLFNFIFSWDHEETNPHGNLLKDCYTPRYICSNTKFCNLPSWVCIDNIIIAINVVIWNTAIYQAGSV